MNNRLIAGACALAIAIATNAKAEEHNHENHANHTNQTSGAMHNHGAGEWMVAYKYKQVNTDGMRNGNDSVAIKDVGAKYGEVPAEMEMRMHMLEIMYGLTDDLTIMLMPQYMEMDMLHVSSHGGGHKHVHEVADFGDTELTGIYKLDDTLSFTFGLSLPTGKDDETFVDHHDNVYHLPYNMQLGTGTYDPILGITYAESEDTWSWGGQLLSYTRLGKNDQGYRQGNKYMASGWLGRNLSDYVQLSGRIDAERWGDVVGRDYSLPLNSIAGADPEQQAGERVMGVVGITFIPSQNFGVFEGSNLKFELGLPIYERFSGPQPETSHMLMVSFGKSF